MTEQTEPRARVILSDNPAHPGQVLKRWIPASELASYVPIMQAFGWVVQLPD